MKKWQVIDNIDANADTVIPIAHFFHLQGGLDMMCKKIIR